MYKEVICLGCSKPFQSKAHNAVRCKECSAAHHQVTARAWKKANNYKEYRLKDKEKDRIRNRKYELSHPEQTKAKSWRNTRSIKGRYRNGKYTATNRGWAWELTLEQYKSIVEGAVCHYCGNNLPETGSGLDRKNNDPFYSLDSVMPCCTECNVSFMHYYTYEEKLMIGETRKQIVAKRKHVNSDST